MAVINTLFSRHSIDTTSVGIGELKQSITTDNLVSFK